MVLKVLSCRLSLIRLTIHESTFLPTVCNGRVKTYHSCQIIWPSSLETLGGGGSGSRSKMGGGNSKVGKFCLNSMWTAGEVIQKLSSLRRFEGMKIVFLGVAQRSRWK